MSTMKTITKVLAAAAVLGVALTASLDAQASHQVEPHVQTPVAATNATLGSWDAMTAWTAPATSSTAASAYSSAGSFPAMHESMWDFMDAFWHE